MFEDLGFYLLFFYRKNGAKKTLAHMNGLLFTFNWGIRIKRIEL